MMSHEELINDIVGEVDRICSMIVSSGYDDIDLEIRISELRWKVREQLPDRAEFFAMVYESRFDRLWSQFRG